jgi:solute carrier family 25 2-oxodicarboxylate transporter 21
VQEPLKRSIKFVSNRFYNDTIIGNNPPSFLAKTLCGFLAGSTEAFCISPFEAVKIRMQAKNRLNVYNSSFHCAKTMLSSEGLFGFYRGIETSMIRSGTWNGVYFGTIYELKRRKTFGDSNFWPGFCGGVLGVCFNHPLDTCAARVRNTLPPDPHRMPWTVFREVWTKEGPRALYQGFQPKVLRLGPGGGLMIVVFSHVSEWLDSLGKKQ